MGYWDAPTQSAEPPSLQSILDAVMILGQQPPQPDLIIMSAAQYDYYCFLLALDKNPTHPFIVFLRRIVDRANGRARFQTLLRYAYEATGFTGSLTELT